MTVLVVAADSQANPTRNSPVNFSVVFSKPVTGFSASLLKLGGSAGPTTAVVTGSGDTYNVAVSGMQRPGAVSLSLPAGMVADAAGNFNQASPTGTIVFDNVAPTVTVSPAAGQATVSNTSTVNFSVLFSEPVVGFGAGSVIIGGSAAATTATVTGSGASYNVAVTGMQQAGTVTLTVPAGVVTDTSGNLNAPSNGAGNSVTFDNTLPTAALRASNITTVSNKAHKFTVTYTDNVGVKASTIGQGDIVVAGPKGYRATATWVKPSSLPGNAASIAAAYTIAAPGGSWDKADNGVYTVTLQYRQISDLAGNSIATPKSGLVLGTFRVGIASARPRSLAAASPFSVVQISRQSPAAAIVQSDSKTVL